MYWDQVLTEVLNKQNSQQRFNLTTVHEFLSAEKKFCHQNLKEKTYRSNLPIQKYYLKEHNPQLYFTAREFQTMHCLLNGKSTLEIAQVLNLSRRTIEFYLKNMKAKLNCKYRTELIKKVLQSDLRGLLLQENLRLGNENPPF